MHDSTALTTPQWYWPTWWTWCTDQQLLQHGQQLHGHSITPRTREDIHAFLTGTHIIEPGVVWAPQWRPEFDPGDHPEQARIYAAVGHKL